MKQVFYCLTYVLIRSDGYSVDVELSPIVRTCILYELFERSIPHMLVTTRLITTRTQSRVPLQISFCVEINRHDVLARHLSIVTVVEPVRDRSPVLWRQSLVRLRHQRALLVATGA
jgi:hypothetical protein